MTRSLGLCRIGAGLVLLVTELLAQASGPALVRHAPLFNSGTVDGSVQQMVGESVTLNGGTVITRQLLVPGTPTVRLNGSPAFGGTIEGTGATTPSDYQVTLNGQVSLGNLVRRTDPVTLPSVSAPPAPTGTRSVIITASGQTAGDFATLRNLTLNGDVGQLGVPAGTFGDFTAEGGSGFTLGVAGATQPSVYNFQRLTLNGTAQIQVLGPVIVNVANGFTTTGALGSSARLSWLALNVYSGPLAFIGRSEVHALVVAPNSTVTLGGDSQLIGSLACDRLTVNGRGLLRVAANVFNAPPSVALTAPVDGAVYPAPASLILQASAQDPDGAITLVEFFNGFAKLGQATAAPYQFVWANVVAGTYTLTARATDERGGTATSSAAIVIVNTLPSVAITGPAPNTVFRAPASITLAAAASDDDGTIAKVEFFNGASKIGEAPSAPYEFAWTGVPAGAYSLSALATDNRGHTTRSANVPIVVDVPPTVQLTSPTAGATFIAPATITLQAAATDSDGTVTKVEFFNGATKLGETTSTPHQVVWSNVGVGNYALTAIATDDSGISTTSSSVSIQVLAPNAAPNVALTAPANGSVLTAPATFSLVASANDSDGSVAKVEFFQGSTKLGDKTTPDVAGGSTFTFTLNSALPAGSYTFTARATDNQNAVSTSTGITVLVNAPPVVAMTAPLNGTVVAAPGTVTLTANASDADGSIAKVEFFNGSTKLGESTTAPYQFTWSNVIAGSYSVTARATDNRNAGTTSAAVTLIVDALPSVSLTAPANNAVFDTRATITLLANATDPDGTVAKVEFYADGNKLGEVTAAPYQFSWNVVPAGMYALTARATDNLGLSSTSAPVPITVNVPPVVAITAPANNSSFLAPASFTLTAEATDSDGTIVKVEFLRDGAKIGEVASAPYQYAVTGLASGSYVFTAKATDDTGSVTTSESVGVIVSLPNDPPFVNAGSDQQIKFTPSSGAIQRGRIVVNNDEWALTDDGFNASPYAGTFARNLADYLTGGKAGAKFLAYTNVLPGSVDFIYTGSQLAAAMQAAGHAWTTSRTIEMTLPNLQQYDAVFLGANSVDNQVLIDYVNAGGSVYLSAGTHWCGCDAEGEAALWNTFLNRFGLTYAAPYNNVSGTLPVTSNHPLFHGIQTLYFANGNSVVQLNPDDPYTEVPFVYQGHGLFGLAGDVVNQVFLRGTVTDDGRPTPPVLTYQWTQVAGPQPATFDAPNALVTRFRVPVSGTYTLRLTANDGNKTGSDDVVVVANMPPQVLAGPDQVLRDVAQVATLTGSASDDGVPGGPQSYLWKVAGGPGTVTFSAPTSPSTTASFGAPGIYTLELAASDGLLGGSDSIEVRVGMESIEPASGLVAWWPMNWSRYDVVSGTRGMSIAASAYVAGKVGGAVQLTGGRSLAVAAAHPDFNLGASAAGFALEFWINSGSPAPAIGWVNGAYFHLYDGNRLAGNFREANGTNHVFDSYQWGGSDTLWISAGTWHHVVITYDRPSGLARFYQNGLLRHTQNFGSFAIASAGDFRLGSTGFSGLLDEVSLYNRPLGHGEVAAIFAAGANGKCPPDNNAPPIVNAGPDLLLPDTATPAALNGVVQEDDRPFGVPTITWAKVEGPGTVTFADPAVAVTTATFSAPGAYLLKLTASDHYTSPVSDPVEVRVGGGFQEPPSGISTWWPGNGSPVDVVHGRNVELINGAGYASGRVLSGFQFPGNGSYGFTPRHADLDIGASAAGFTIEFWMNSTSSATMLAWSGGASFHLFDGNRFAGNLREANGTNHNFDTYSLGGEVIWTNVGWHHIAVTYDRPAGVVRMYQNGRLMQTVSLGSFALATSGDLYFGSAGFVGMLDEVTLYKRPLSIAEIAALYSAGSQGKSLPDDNLPPTVNAGLDVLVRTTGTSAQLIGSILDDNRPFGAPVATWTKIDGPGDVVFGDATAAQTSATFSAAGTYLLRLTASDRATQPVSDLVEVRVGGGYLEPAPGMAAWWPGNGEPHEMINGNHDVELINGATYAAAKVSQGFRFPGMGGYGRVTRHADLDIGTSLDGFTIEFWMNSTSSASMLAWSGGASFYLFDGNRFAGNLREANGTNHAFDTYSLGGGEVMWTHTAPWHHIAITYDRPAGVTRMFQNGRLMQTVNFGSFALGTSGDLLLGSAGFSGWLDELALYRRPLTPAEIAAIHQAGATGRSAPDNNTPPAVNAGPDIALESVSASATLNGSVVDDQRPFGAPTVSWTKLEGAGTVAFGAAQSAQTTATFSAAGLYLLRLTADDGYSPPVSDVMEVRVGSGYAGVPPGVAAWWPGNGAPHELINGGHDVELVNGATYGSGKVGQAFRFVGTSDYGRVLRHADLDIGASADGCSIEFWVNSTSSATMLSWSGGASFHLFDGNRFAGNLREANGTNHVFDTYTLGGGEVMWTYTAPWNHIVVTCERPTGQVRMYLNGQLKQSVNFGSFALGTTGDLVLGGGSFVGLLDELTLYRRPLTGAEVASIYAAGALGKNPQINRAPSVNAGADLSAFVNAPLTLTGTATDDGLPNPPAALTYQWTRVGGPGNVTFSTANALTTSATFDATGSHTLRLTASDSALSGSDEVVVAVTAPASNPPTVAITSPVNNGKYAENTPFTVTATAADSDGTIAKVEFFRDMTLLGEDNSAPYAFNVAGGLPLGSHALTARATDNTGVASTSLPVTVNVVTDPGPPFAEITVPAEDVRVTAPLAIRGVANSTVFAGWTLEQRLKGGEGGPEETWTAFASGTSPVGTPPAQTEPLVDGALATFDPTRLINGIYELRLKVTDTAGRVQIAGPITLIVEGNMKIGAFSLAFEDLKLPVVGIPITITRTYDSRDSRVGDFGPGWRVALNNVRVQKNRHLGNGWWQTPQQGSGLQFYYVESVTDRIVTVVMPDGETHRFRAGAYVKVREGDPDNASFAVVVTHGKYRFYPIGDTTSKLEPLNAANQLAEDFWIAGTGDQDLRADDPAVEPFAPNFNTSRYRLTTSDGTVFIVDEALGLLEMRDLDGNTLVLNRDAQNRVSGVTATQDAPGGPIARSVSIVRDATGRVDYIRDPAGRDLDYLYDGQGRLESFTNRELNVTQFRYENATFPFYLTKIIDPRGVAALRSEYDSAGKLIKQIDADGKETIFNRGIDTTGRFEKVKDRLGNETTFYYDERGNVTLKLDPLGAQTNYSYWPDSDRVKFEVDHYGNVKSSAYDARGNVTVQTIGASTSEDPANPTTGYTTRTTYNAQSAPTRITDPDGRVQTFTYDPTTNNLLTHTIGDPSPISGLPSTTSSTYKTDGTLDTITDALGNTTSHVYNYTFSDPAHPSAVKQITVTVTDPAGAVGSDPSNASHAVLRSTRTLFDPQENQLAQIVSRTLPDGSTEDVVTRYVYDAENRLKATILPDGRVTETRYTSFGKEEKTVLWTSVADYQTHNDASARITTFGYDSRGNQTSITYADGTTEATGYDLENRKIWSQDRRGYRTFFVYDAVGRLRFTIFPNANDGVGASAPSAADDPRLADNPRTETVYDLVGRVSDTYDELRRRTQTVYFPDGTPDAARRKQMVAVRSAGNLITNYQYDKAGNVRFVTDPRGNTVETRYDDHGRLRSVVYPATDEHPVTQTETRYDPLGRRVEVIGQEGKVTRYRYDGLSRLTEVRQYLDQTAAASDSDFNLGIGDARVVSTRYSYDEIGSQTTQSDALDRTTRYEYDKLGRRTKRILPKDASEASALSEVLVYDAWGNLGQRTDFAGKTTTFGYDLLNRLTSKAADPTHPSLAYSHAIARIEFDYDANGARTAGRTFNAGNTQLYAETTPRDERGRLDYKDAANGRLDYSYYANNLLKDTVSSNSAGINVGYRYDEVNRLEFVDDTSTGLPTRTTQYTYNANGSLETVTTPNGIQHAYQYDTLNRLRTLAVTVGVAMTGGPALGTVQHAYDYKLRASGHRRHVIEGAKTTTYTYDDLYRLTDETVIGDANANNGSIGYTLDKVGNRSARTSSVASVPSVLNQTFNARDWLTSDTYDPNGNTIVGQVSDLTLRGNDVYDFENRLILRAKSDGSAINISYNGDGHRVGKNVLNASAQPVSSTIWLVDTNNLTGYAQVFEERVTTAGATPSSIVRIYTYGSDLISQAISLNEQPSTLSYFACDGYGSTRELTDSSGTVTDRYDYDAFGNLTFNSGATANMYRYAGEQYDADLGLYYLRARYLNPDSGRFWSMDSYEGKNSDPMSLHKYLYANADPVRFRDPSGHESLVSLNLQGFVRTTFLAIAVPAIKVTTDVAYGTVIVLVVVNSARNAIIAMHVDDTSKAESGGKEAGAAGEKAADAGKETRPATEEELEQILGEGWHPAGEKKKFAGSFSGEKDFKKLGTNNPDVRIGKNGEIILRHPKDPSKTFDTGLKIKQFQP